MLGMEWHGVELLSACAPFPHWHCWQSRHIAATFLPTPFQTKLADTIRLEARYSRVEGVGEGGLLHVLWVERDLMVHLTKVNHGEDCTAACLGGKIQHVRQRVDIQPCYQDEPVKVATGMPSAIRVLHHEWRAGPWGGGQPDDAVFLRLLEFCLGCRQLLPYQFPNLEAMGGP
jgi:hypothetical protein